MLISEGALSQLSDAINMKMRESLFKEMRGEWGGGLDATVGKNKGQQDGDLHRSVAM